MTTPIDARPTDARPTDARPTDARRSRREGGRSSREEPARAAGADETRLRPAALARVWMGVRRAHETIAVPGVVLSPGDVLVRVELAAVGEADVEASDGLAAAPNPTVLGSEYVGRIAAVSGPVVAIDGAVLELGERVVCARAPYERIGPRRELVGAFATHVHVRAGTSIARVGETLPAAVLVSIAGATTRAAGLVRIAADRTELAGASVRIDGGSLLALTVGAMLRERGSHVSSVIEDPHRRTLARRFGLTIASSSDAADLVLPVDCLERRARGTMRSRHLEKDAAPGSVQRGSRDLRDAVAFMRSAAARAYPFADAVAAALPLPRLEEAFELVRCGTHTRVAIAPGG